MSNIPYSIFMWDYFKSSD